MSNSRHRGVMPVFLAGFPRVCHSTEGLKSQACCGRSRPRSVRWWCWPGARRRRRGLRRRLAARSMCAFMVRRAASTSPLATASTMGSCITSEGRGLAGGLERALRGTVPSTCTSTSTSSTDRRSACASSGETLPHGRSGARSCSSASAWKPPRCRLPPAHPRDHPRGTRTSHSALDVVLTRSTRYAPAARRRRNGPIRRDNIGQAVIDAGRVVLGERGSASTRPLEAAPPTNAWQHAKPR